MLEKFTQKAIDVVTFAQDSAKNMGHNKIHSEHLLLALIFQTKGVQAKILNFEKIDKKELAKMVNQAVLQKEKCLQGSANVVFSESARSIIEETILVAQKYDSKFIMPQHIAFTVFTSKNSGSYEIIKNLNLDEEKIISNLKRILEKKTKGNFEHPEANVEVLNPVLANINNFFKEKNVAEILNNAVSKLSTCGYEILGTEQILQSILENNDYDITKFLDSNGIDKEVFAQKLQTISSRSFEFENSEKQIIFTPNAFRAMLMAIDTARELGSVEIKPEHIFLGMLKTKTGIAYHILKDLVKDTVGFEEKITKEITGKTPEMLSILRLAKQEAQNFDSQTIGTETLLLGILALGSGVGATVLQKLGITLKDARCEVEKIIGCANSTSNAGFEYTPRAKKVLECAYEIAKSHNRTKISSENLLYAITRQQDCLAMKVLEALGTDIVEIKYGIKNEIGEII